MTSLVVVTGLPRTGTSAVAGMLAALGANCGSELVKTDQHNSKGYFEDVLASKLHRAMLVTDSLIRLAPPASILLAKYRDYVLGRAAAAATGQPQVIKDPMAFYFLQHLLAMLATSDYAKSVQPVIVICRRPFFESVNSYAMISKWEVRHTAAHLSAHLYALDREILLVRQMSQRTTILTIDYHQLLTAPAEQCRRLCGAVGLAVPPEAVARAATHIDPGLKHY